MGAAERLVRELHEAYNAHDASAAAALYADTGRHIEMATGGERRGPDRIAESLERLLGAFPDLRWEARDLIAQGDRAALSYLMTGTLEAPFGPFEPAGQQLSLPGVQLVVVGGDRIAVCEDYWDAASFGRQMKG